jgi:ribose transport system permease protein
MKKSMGTDWLASAIGIIALWTILSYQNGGISLSSISGILISAAFLTIVSLGQAFTITSGRANIDLSVANMVTLGAFLSTRLLNAIPDQPFFAVVLTVATGAVIGIANGVLVSIVRLPAIIVTLGTGYILATACEVLNEGLNPMADFGLLTSLTTGRFLTIPSMFLTAIIFTIAFIVLLRWTAFGHLLIAIGQSDRAAALAGANVHLVTVICFVISATLAALVGALLAAHSGGAFLDMGTPYLIQSVGAVVIGGTSIVGGRTTFVGTMFGAMMLVLLVTTMQVLRLPIGIQEIIEGVIVTFILLLSNVWSKQR